MEVIFTNTVSLIYPMSGKILLNDTQNRVDRTFMEDKCGVIAVKTISGKAALQTYYGLYALQHRGQEGAGIVTFDGFKQHTKKGLGLVGEVFRENDLEELTGRSAIGHVRYPTSGSIDKKTVHPFNVNTKQGFLALGHNGNLVNTKLIRNDLEKVGHVFTTDTDTEVLVHDLARNLIDSQLPEAVRETVNRIKGAYSTTLIYNGQVVAFRDPQGIRPLCVGKLDGGYMAASESVAIDVVGGKFVRDVKPGELVVLEEDGIKSHKIANPDPAHCFFEYIYFARPDSSLEGKSVYGVRRRLGELLYENHGARTDLVSPVPDSGRAFAAGYAEAGGIEYIESMMKNRYVGRTFIMPSQETRERAVRLKLNPITPNIQGKKITIIDDSIVRGTTSRQLINMLRNNGAEEVHVRIGAPPIISPCNLGIDMASRHELMASQKSVSEIRDKIGADSLEYLTMKEISQVLNIPLRNLCTGCVTGKYPVS